MPKIEEEIGFLLAKHKHGVVIRLHVLGDFYSMDYVQFWMRMLTMHPKLSIFGYTGVPVDGNIATSIQLMNSIYTSQCFIRFSRNNEFDDEGSYAAEESFEGKSFDCLEQTKKAKNCAACGLCWMTAKTVRFVTH